MSRSENVEQGAPLIRIDNPELLAKAGRHKIRWARNSKASMR